MTVTDDRVSDDLGEMNRGDRRSESLSEDRRQRPARAGDGTLPESEDRPDINWFGSSKRPAEEFLNDHRPEHDNRPPDATTGEGLRKNHGNKNQAAPSGAPEPDEVSGDVFPTGGPEAQSDG